MGISPLRVALTDVASAFLQAPLSAMLGWQDVRQRYRRSSLGPFWLTLSMGVMIGAIGLVFGQVFNAPMTEFLPFLATGLVLWGLISTTVTEGCQSFVGAEGIIKQLPIPLFVHVLRMLWRNFIIFFHNLIIVPVVFLVVGKPVDWVALLAVPGLLVLSLNLAWLSLLLGTVCARYRDFPQIVGNAIQVVFYLTPIIWMPGLVSGRTGTFLLDMNPLYHLIEIVRAPILGEYPSEMNWIVSVACALVG